MYMCLGRRLLHSPAGRLERCLLLHHRARHSSLTIRYGIAWRACSGASSSRDCCGRSKSTTHNPQSTVMVSLISLCHEISSWLMHGGTRTHTRTTRRKVNTRPARRQTVGQHWRGSTYCFLLLLFFAADIAEGIEARRIGSLRLPHTDYYGSNSIRRSPSVGHLVAPGRHQASSVQATPVSC